MSSPRRRACTRRACARPTRFFLVSHLAMMRDYDRDRSGPYTATETFREVTRERSLSGAELDNTHALVRLGLNLAERTDYGREHDAAVRRILEGTPAPPFPTHFGPSPTAPPAPPPHRRPVPGSGSHRPPESTRRPRLPQ